MDMDVRTVLNPQDQKKETKMAMTFPCQRASCEMEMDYYSTQRNSSRINSSNSNSSISSSSGIIISHDHDASTSASVRGSGIAESGVSIRLHRHCQLGKEMKNENFG